MLGHSHLPTSMTSHSIFPEMVIAALDIPDPTVPSDHPEVSRGLCETEGNIGIIT